MKKEHLKDLFLMWKINPSQESWFHTRKAYFPFNARLVVFTKTFTFNKFKNYPNAVVTTKYLENIMFLTLYINHLNPHQATSVLGQIMPNYLALNPTVNYRMNSTLSMEGFCLDCFRKKVNVSNFYDNGGGCVPQYIDRLR